MGPSFLPLNQTIPLTVATFGTLDWAVVVIYWLAMIGIALWAGKRDANAESFFLGGRNLPSWALAVSIVASALSAATFIGAPDQAYRGDLSYLILNLGGFLAVFIVGFLFVPKLYQAGTITIYGYLAQRFGPTSRTAVSLMFLFGRLLASGARLFLAAIPLCLLIFGTHQPTTGQLVIAIGLIGVIGTFYTTLGGIRAVVWTDTVQLSLVVFAVLLSIGLLLYKIPLSIPEIYQTLATPGTGTSATTSKLHFWDWSWDWSKPYTFWSAVFGVVFLNVAAYGVDHDFAQRFMVSRSVKHGARSVIGAQFVGIGVVMLFMIVGLLLWIYYQRPDIMGAGAPSVVPEGGVQAAYPIFLANELPPIVAGLAFAGFFAVAQGSLDSAINAMASSLIADLWLPMKKRLGYAVDEKTASGAPKVAVMLLGGATVLFAIYCAIIYDPKSKTLLDFALGVMTFAFAGMLGVFLTALFTRRGNNISVLLALVTGVVVITLLQDRTLSWWSAKVFGEPMKLAWTWWMPIGVTASFLVCVLGRKNG